MSGFDVENLWKLSENHDEFAEYVEARLQGKLFRGKPVEPVFDTYLGEIPEDFLEDACELDKEGTFKERLGKVVEELLLYKLKEHNAEDSTNREYVSRLIYLAEVLELKFAFYIIYGFVQCTEYMELSGAHTSDIYTQFLRALAQFQPPRDLARFWFKRFHHDDYIRYAQPLFTGLRRSSYEDATLSLPRLFILASQYPEHLDQNRALRPFVKKFVDDDNVAEEIIQGFISLTVQNQRRVVDSIRNLHQDLEEPLAKLFVEGLLRQIEIFQITSFPDYQITTQHEIHF